MYRLHGKGTTTMAVISGKRRLHTTFNDGVEMVEEYDIITDQLLVRKWKEKTKLGNDGNWDFEIGESSRNFPQNESGISASRDNPVFISQDEKEAWIWRIRNLPYPIDNYSITIDSEKHDIVLRTKNKKYFKRFKIPNIIRKNLLPYDANNLSMEHNNNTLVIQYDKPDEILEDEQQAKIARLSSNKGKEGDVQCNQQ